MAAGRIIIPGMMPAEDGNGNRLPGAKLWFYDNETTTLKAIYTTSALTTTHPNPVVASDVGVFDAIWADSAEEYTVVGTESDNTPLPGVNYDGVVASLSAVLASADLAEAAQAAAELARDETVAIADEFGTLDAAITAAQLAETNAETAETNAETAETNAEAARDAALAAQAAAEAARDDAETIVGFDPTKVVVVDEASGFTAGEQLQGRQNIGAQPELGLVDREKVSRPSISAGVLTLDAAVASVFEVNFNANITSLVVSNWAAGTDSQTITLILIGDGTARTHAFGAAYKPAGGAAFTLSTTLNHYNFLTLNTRNAGTRVDYFYAGATQ